MILKILSPAQRKNKQSRRDDTLLTVGFNLRTIDAQKYLSPARDDTLLSDKCDASVVPAGIGHIHEMFSLRRLRVSSLRDLVEKECIPFLHFNMAKLRNMSQ